MDQVLLINSLIESERAVELKDDRRSQQRYEPYVNYLAATGRRRVDRKSFLDRLFPKQRVEAVGTSEWEIALLR